MPLGLEQVLNRGPEGVYSVDGLVNGGGGLLGRNVLHGTKLLSASKARRVTLVSASQSSARACATARLLGPATQVPTE